MIHCVWFCDQCGKSEPHTRAYDWLVVTHLHPETGNLYAARQEPIIAHLCSMVCLAKWAPREELKRRKQKDVPMAMTGGVQ